jgi:hypothetical protein
VGVNGGATPVKLKCFNLHKSYIAIEKKHQITIKNDNMSYNENYGNLPEYDEEQEQHSCEILDTSRFVMGNGIASDDDSSDEYDYDFNIQDLQSPKAATETNTNTATQTHPHFDLNDPLRYCLEIGEITQNEYDKWKIVATKLFKRTTPQLDLGPGYNDTDDTDDTDDDETTPAAGYGYEYGYGYVTQLQRPHHVEFYDPWFPNPDPTPNKQYKQYTKIATNPRHMMQQFVVFENDGEQSRLNYAFQLKLIWERFTTSASSSNPQSLQHFWQTNALDIYEALQELVEIQAKCFSPLSGGAHKLIPDTPTPTPEFHTTPVEMLDNTFETIGRMSRCIAEDFNTQSVVNYVDEFIHALYTELRYVGLCPL